MLGLAAAGPALGQADLQVVSIARTPRYQRYDPLYTGYQITEPSGFGPYVFSAATGLGSGQTPQTQRWPLAGQAITYTATVRNRGTAAWTTPIHGEWSIDGVAVQAPVLPPPLQPGQTAAFTLPRTWDDQLHDITFTVLDADARAGNNTISRGSKGAGFLTYIDRTFLDTFRSNTAQYPQAATDDLIDWLNMHMARFNAMMAAAGTDKRVHYEVLEVLPDAAPDPAVDRLQFAIFPFRYHAGEGDPRLSGYYNAAEDIDFGLLHEEGHQLGLIDIYRLDVPGSLNDVSGLPYSAPDGLMRSCAPFVSANSAGAMQQWLGIVHGYYGQYLYSMPQQVFVRFRGLSGEPLAGAGVTAYQKIEMPGGVVRIPAQVKFQGVTDGNGRLLLPNVPINPALVPPTAAGTLRPNPFGYLAVVGTNGLLHFKVQYGGFTDYAWLDILEVNNAYWSGQTSETTFERPLLLGGVVQTQPPPDLAELNAGSWLAWAEGAAASVHDDPAVTVSGQGSVRFETSGGFDTSLRYPGDRLARWDLSRTQDIRFWARSENPNVGFQSETPWVRLISESGYYEWRSATTALNETRGQWVEFVIPVDGSADWPRSIVGSPSLASVNGFEVHADTWDAGFTLWVDGVRFDPPPCRPDCNSDGILNLSDFGCFTTRFATGDPYADCNGDGVRNLSDFGCFTTTFALGCP
ncbi:MAG: hypothetical protein IT437_13390 [Phycisphaerales bacterium]|nr:hypothetical protein [Phycisphaerales bacterium]